MNIQSLSIVVPTNNCWNDCAFCVSKMHHETYGRSIINNDDIPQSYLNRIQFVRDEGCNSMILTGTAEPQQNLPFIYKLLTYNSNMRLPFYNITIQTTASGLYPEDIENLATMGVTTFALSMSSFSELAHWEITHTPKNKQTISFGNLFDAVKRNNMNLRVCFNLTDEFINVSPSYYFDWAEECGVDQVTFRKIYADGKNEKADWVWAHEFPNEKFKAIKIYVKYEGTPINTLPYGFIQYDVKGISTVIDDDCMSKDNIEEMKYAILRPNGHLYSRWDSKGSLIF